MENLPTSSDQADRDSTQQRLLSAVFGCSMDCVVIIDRHGTVVEFNPAAESAFGIPRSEALGREMASIIIPERYRERHRRGMARLLETGETTILGRRVELSAMRANGEEFPVELTVTRVPTEGVPFFAGFIRDITDRRGAEETLRERATQAAHYQAVLVDLVKLECPDLDSALREITRIDADALNTSRVGVWFLETNGAELSCRSLFDSRGGGNAMEGFRIRAADYPRYFDALRGNRAIAVTDACSDPATSEFADGYLRPLEITSMLDVPIWRRGKMIGIVCHEHRGPVREWKTEEQDFAGSIADMVSIAVETEEQRRAESALQQAHEALQKAHEDLERRVDERTEQLRLSTEAAENANRAKSEFLSRMSHELRTPMNSILGFAQVLSRKSLPPSERKSVDHILKAGRHLLELINEVLDLSRIEANRMRLSAEPVRVAHVVQETLTLIQPLAEDCGCEVTETVSEGPDLYVLADRQRLTQVLLNLVSNGLKYNHAGGSVTIGCEAEDPGRARLSVADTGRGIPAERLERLFSPFERLDADGYGVEGTGLGLALSKRLVEAMGGSISVESEVGRGSAFWIELAVAENPSARLRRKRRARAAAAPDTADGKTHALLYIEDNVSNFALIDTVLADRPSVELLSALHASAGLDLARRHRPDLILLDLHLPDMPGEKVLRELQADPRTRSIPVVIVSADATPGQRERLKAAGARDYLTKPLDVDRFLAAVDSTLAAAQP